MDKHVEKIEEPLDGSQIKHLTTIESLYFAYRDFIADPDRILEEYGLGRAHHRVLYFVNRTPGMSVAQLLNILQITKQSLSRVLRQLIDSGHIIQTEDAGDRRRRPLFPTVKGRQLVLDLSAPQSSRIEKAMQNLNGHEREIIQKFLTEMTGSTTVPANRERSKKSGD